MRHILQDAAKHLKHQLLLLLLKFTLLLELLKFEAFPLEEKLRARMAELGGPCKQREPCRFGIVFEHIILFNCRLSTNLPALQEGAVPVMFALLDARSMTCG